MSKNGPSLSELRAELGRRGLDQKGTIAALRARLAAAETGTTPSTKLAGATPARAVTIKDSSAVKPVQTGLPKRQARAPRVVASKALNSALASSQPISNNATNNISNVDANSSTRSVAASSNAVSGVAVSALSAEQARQARALRFARAGPTNGSAAGVSNPPASASAREDAVSNDERKRKRAERFGTETEQMKRQKRAERFASATAANGDSISSTNNGGSDSSSSSTTTTTTTTTTNGVGSIEDRIRQRRERFGIVSEEERRVQRGERFGTLSEEQKRAKRAARFASSAPAVAAVKLA